MRHLDLKPIAALALTATLIVSALGILAPLFLPKNNEASFGQLDPEAHGVLGEPRDTLDVLFLGDSEVYTSLSPIQMWREHGFASYDVSTSAQPLPYTRTLLTRALSEQSPRVVVLETNMLFRRVSPDKALWRELADRLPILEYHNRWKSLRGVDTSAQIKTTWTDPSKGFRANDKIVPSRNTGYMKRTDKRAHIPLLNQYYLDTIIDMCRERDIQVVLLSTPSTKNWSWKRHNAVEHYLDERPDLSGVTYLDLNLEPQVAIDWKRDTRDGGDHLNRTGARKVSAYVGSWLAEHYDLPDHRVDAAYRPWNAAAKTA